MRAMVLHEPGPLGDGRRLRRTEVPPPVPAGGEVRIEVAACAVCRTDLQLVEGDLPARRLPIVPGHQVVGRVAALGPNAPTGAPTVGSRVGLAWTGGACGTCRFCRGGRENLCDDLAFTGWSRDGGYATEVTARADWVHPLPESFADLDAAPLLCGGAIGYRSLRVAGVLGDGPGGGPAGGASAAGLRLGLYGFGASATLAIQLAVHVGIEVFVATRSRQERLAAERLGAAWTGGYDDRPPQPLDAAITFAPSGEVVVAALRAVDRGGVVAINAIHLDRIPQFDYDLLWMERQLRSVANVTRADVREFLQLAAAIPLRTRTEVFALDAAEEALTRLRDGRIAGAAVLDMG